MSDQRVLTVRRAFRLEPNMETARNLVRELRRADPEVEGFRLAFVKKPYSYGRAAWCAWWEDVLNPAGVCAKCGGHGKYSYGDENQWSTSCNECLGMGTPKDLLTTMRLTEFNRVVDSLEGRFLIGKFKRTKKDELKWLGR